ncbi:MAG: AIR synthase family protein [Candidatus Bathyarchaeia archaeon]
MINLSRVGKFPQDLMEKLVYPKLGGRRPEILVSPGHGLDNAVVQLGYNQVLIVTSDPLSVIPALGLEDSAWLSVHLLASDLCTCGFPPHFIVVNLSLPPHMKNEEFRDYWNAFHKECENLGIAILGGHTGRYVGSDYTIIGGGVMMTLAPENRYLASNMAKPGDSIIMTKGVAVAATGILARTFPETIEKAYGSSFLKRAQSHFYQFSVVEDALTAASVGLRDNGVTAMHDVTEGGLLGALYELSKASEVGLEIDLSDVIITEEERLVCGLFHLDPYVTLSEGTLIITVKSEKAQNVLKALESKRIKARVIGEIEDLQYGRWVKHERERQHLKKPTTDPYWQAYWKAHQEGWT